MANSALALDAILSAPARSSRPSIARILFERFKTARRAEAEQVVARYIQLNGGRLTDDLEREISRKFGDFAG